jgi:hypothetical protein
MYVYTPSPAKHFIPHSAQNQVELVGQPARVLVTPLAYEQMFHLADIAPSEVGCLGVCDRVGNTFTISEIFMFRQVVEGMSNTITTEGLAEFAQQLFEVKGDEAAELLGRIRYWGHSHGDAGTGESPQDNTTMDELAESGHDFMVRGIFNRRGEIRFTICLYSQGIKITDVPWGFFTPDDARIRERIKAQYDELVTVKQPQMHAGYAGVVQGDDDEFEAQEGHFGTPPIPHRVGFVGHDDTVVAVSPVPLSPAVRVLFGEGGGNGSHGPSEGGTENTPGEGRDA